MRTLLIKGICLAGVSLLASCGSTRKVSLTGPDDFPVIFGAQPFIVAAESSGGKIPNASKARVINQQLVIPLKFYSFCSGAGDKLKVDPDGTQHWYRGANEIYRCELCHITCMEGGCSEYEGALIGLAAPPSSPLFLICYNPQKPETATVSLTRPELLKRGWSAQKYGSVPLDKCKVVRLLGKRCDKYEEIGTVDMDLVALSPQEFALELRPGSQPPIELAGPCMKLRRVRRVKREDITWER